MKALSIRQPWAELILQGRKTIELRTWTTEHRGPLAIHAAYTVQVEACADYGLDPAALARGVVVGIVDLLEVARLTPEEWEAERERHLDLGPFPGRIFGWRLANPRRLPQPLPLSGQRGVFDVPDPNP
jgi:activating signal cointegrator 1